MASPPTTRLDRFWGSFFAVGTLACSVALITFNKYLMDKDRFPFPVPLVMIHMAVNSSISVVLRLVWPSLFPSLTNPSTKIKVSVGLVFKGVLPIAVCFLGALVFSNAAYSYCGIAFLQFMKESNIVLVYTFSLIFALEVFQERTCMIVIVLVLSTCMTIKGELNFNPTGFILQIISQLCETTRIVLQGKFLTDGAKLDAFTFVLLVTPWSLGLLACFAGLILIHGPIVGFSLPAWPAFHAWWPLLLASASLAYVLNVFTALLIKQCGPIASCLVGITKDSIIVLAGTCFMGEVLSRQQVVGFVLQVICINLWACFKFFPELLSMDLASIRLVISGFPNGLREKVSIAQETVDTRSYGTGKLESIQLPTTAENRC